MSLVLEIEHLLGVAFAAQSQASPAPDWPPQPDRVFSALVAAWGARGERADERRALEWLETQPIPELAASGGFARTPVTVFVPPNDPETGRVGNRSVMPTLRRRQPRRFPAFRPDDPVVQLIWRDVEADDEMIRALNALAAATAYIGHSSSLTRCRFRTDGAPERAASPRRRVYQGRLAELERNYQASRRPNPGEDARAAPGVDCELPRGVFSDRWLVLEHVEGQMPDLRAAALVSKALRCALMAGYKRTGREAAVPAVVSGHAAGGSPSAEPHLAIGPLAFLGSRFADGRVFGFALVTPTRISATPSGRSRRGKRTKAGASCSWFAMAST
jgi:CRISPR-associated protein Csb2